MRGPTCSYGNLISTVKNIKAKPFEKIFKLNFKILYILALNLTSLIPNLCYFALSNNLITNLF